MGTQNPDPETPSKTADSHTAAPGAEDDADDRPPVKWVKRILAVAGAVVTIGGAIGVISQTTHWLDGITHASAHSSPSFSEIERSPILGISFHQNGQLDPMSLSYPNGTSQNPAVDVSVQSEPFEVWFPTLGSESAVEVCASRSNAIYHDIPLTGRSGVFTCLTPGTGVADYTSASGYLPVSIPPADIAHTQIEGTRAEPASGGGPKILRI